MVQAIPFISGPISKTDKYSDGAIGRVIKQRAAQILSFERLEDLSRVYNVLTITKVVNQGMIG
jgi:hypothetical protein